MDAASEDRAGDEGSVQPAHAWSPPVRGCGCQSPSPLLSFAGRGRSLSKGPEAGAGHWGTEEHQTQGPGHQWAVWGRAGLGSCGPGVRRLLSSSRGGRCLGRGGDRRRSRAQRGGTALVQVGWAGVEGLEGDTASCDQEKEMLCPERGGVSGGTGFPLLSRATESVAGGG